MFNKIFCAILFFITLSVIIFSLPACTSSKGDPDEIWLYKKKPNQYYFNYDTTLTEAENFFSGYTDTFSIAGTTFKIFCDPNPTGELEIMMQKNGQWVHNIDSYFGVNGYDRKSDINNDGYPDFQFFSQTNSHIYLFNDSAKCFDDFAGEISLLYAVADSSRNIFFQEWLQTTHEYQSDLLTYKNRKPYYLFMLYTLPKKNNEQLNTTVRLYKCNEGKLNDTLFIKEQTLNLPVEKFNAKQYWNALYNE